MLWNIPFISNMAVSGTSLPSWASCKARRFACSSSPTTTMTARRLKPSKGRILRRCAEGNMFVCHNAQHYNYRSHNSFFLICGDHTTVFRPNLKYELLISICSNKIQHGWQNFIGNIHSQMGIFYTTAVQESFPCCLIINKPTLFFYYSHTINASQDSS